jgi:trehalose-phosphatase
MEAVPYPGVREVLSRIMHFGGRVIVISGRPAGEVDQLLALPVRPEIWGCHGWERLHPDGRMERFPMSKLQSEGIARVDFLLTREGLTGQLEKKYGSIALHWRGMGEEQISDLRSTGLRAMEPVVNESLGLRRFDGGLELRALGRDKGTAVQAILDEAGDSFGAVYLGDDATDEDAFNAISGMGLGVLVRPEHRRSAASVWLKPPDELLGFLMLWEDLTSGKFFNR